jgi:hypothetical protein
MRTKPLRGASFITPLLRIASTLSSKRSASLLKLGKLVLFRIDVDKFRLNLFQFSKASKNSSIVNPALAIKLRKVPRATSKWFGTDTDAWRI